MSLRYARRVAAFALAATLAAATAHSEETIDIHQHAPQAQVRAQIDRYAQVDVSYDESVLSQPEKDALAKLVQAASVMDEIFLRQVWEGNPALRKQLVYAVSTDAKNKALWDDLYHFFRINVGPWNRLEHFRPFIGNLEHPDGAGFYPTDMTKEEFEKYTAAHPDQADALKGYFTKVERGDHGALRAVPYSVAYKQFLDKAAELLNGAADILAASPSAGHEGVDYTTLAKFLHSRAAAFGSNDYFQSDMDWMDVDKNIVDVTMGPYEVYEDNLFNYKASFEAFIAIRNPADSKALADLKNYLPAMERNLPIPDKHKNMHRGTDSPISVVDIVYEGGDCKAGVQTIAFNLPNDERVREAKGSKKVLLKNIARAKYDKILIPIAKQVLAESQMKYVNFDSYFSNTLMHELAHGLGPGIITLPNGKKTTVNRALQTMYSPLEEAKADIMGLYNKEFLVKQKYMTQAELEKSYVCFLPGFFRAIRFGTNEAHGKANLIEYNYLKEKGAIVLDAKTGRYSIDLAKMPDAVRSLTHDLCMLEALGDYNNAKAFVDKYTTTPPEIETQLQKLKGIPTDIEPVYSASKFLQS